MYRFVFAALFAVSFATTAFAQSTANDPLTLSIVPENPRPFETVTVTPQSTLLDLTAAKITVSVNGTVIENGGGVQSVPVTVAGPGGTTAITVKARVGGQTVTKQVTLHPADVALIVEPVSTTHPFYLGASLTAAEGRVRIIAIPDLRTSPKARLSASSLIYTWKWGDKVLSEQSGIGRSTLQAVAPVRYRDAQISVTVTNPEGTLVAESSTLISPADPVVRVYPADPLQGPDFNNALTNTYTMNAGEQAFRAVGYFFGTAPSLAWSVNGQSASNDRDVTVRTTGVGEGNADLSVTASTPNDQPASFSLPIHFGGKKSNNIFGF